MEIRPAQRFSWSRQGTGGQDTDIGLPVTYKSGTGVPVQQHQVEGDRQSQSQATGKEVGRQRSVSRERWSFSPPRKGIERPSKPLTRSLAARRQRQKERAGHGQRAEQMYRGGQLDSNNN